MERVAHQVTLASQILQEPLAVQAGAWGWRVAPVWVGPVESGGPPGG